MPVVSARSAHTSALHSALNLVKTHYLPHFPTFLAFPPYSLSHRPDQFRLSWLFKHLQACHDRFKFTVRVGACTVPQRMVGSHGCGVWGRRRRFAAVAAGEPHHPGRAEQAPRRQRLLSPPRPGKESRLSEGGARWAADADTNTRCSCVQGGPLMPINFSVHRLHNGKTVEVTDPPIVPAAVSAHDTVSGVKRTVPPPDPASASMLTRYGGR